MSKKKLKTNNKIKWDSSLDIIRIFAFISVISVHFFAYSEFYTEPVLGKRMFLMVMLRTFFMCCVPLFMVLTGYLMNNKKISKDYYKGIFRVIIIYLLASICCLLFSMHTSPITFKDAILKLLDFTGAPYAWYIEMYLGLYLIIPFLNLAYHNLDSKKHKQVLVVTLIILTSLPYIFNNHVKIFPAWWINIYPISYYFIGAYLSEYFPKVKFKTLFLLLIVHILGIGFFIYHRSYGNTFDVSGWGEWGALTNVITTVLVFMILKKIKTDNWNIKAKKIIKYIASLCLGAYLVSWIFDTLFYPSLLEKVPSMVQRLKYMGVIVPLIILCSLLLSVIITFISKLVLKIIYRRKEGIKNVYMY